jgi:hypothetical protein
VTVIGYADFTVEKLPFHSLIAQGRCREWELVAVQFRTGTGE